MPIKIPSFEETAAEHRAGDERCGRPWQCTCAACIQVREGIDKSEWLERIKNCYLCHKPLKPRQHKALVFNEGWCHAKCLRKKRQTAS